MIFGSWAEMIKMSTIGTEKDYVASVSLCRFFLCEADDAAARITFLEAASLGTVSDFDAYRERIAPDEARLGDDDDRDTD